MQTADVPASSSEATGSARPFEVIDAHVHVGTWKYQPAEDYLAALHRHGMRRGVLVQFLGNSDNRYLERSVAADRARFAGIGLVDADDATAPALIADLAARGVLDGVRLPATARSPGHDPLAVWRTIAEHGLLASVCGPFAALTDGSFADVVAAVPGLRFRLEHLGGVKTAEEPAPFDRFRRFLRLAEHPLATTTWSGFFLNAATPYPYPDATPFLELCLAAFGAERIMWSGDWNRPGLQDADYDAAIGHTAGQPFLDEEQRRLILGGTAASLFFGETSR